MEYVLDRINRYNIRCDRHAYIEKQTALLSARLSGRTLPTVRGEDEIDAIVVRGKYMLHWNIRDGKEEFSFGRMIHPIRRTFPL
jgi:hypothetical protein